ncbi:MAG: EAL domain-containing protein, partial [Bacilli bacterium]|nr:EAL domain-containing protein [Bacilli bacterium]
MKKFLNKVLELTGFKKNTKYVGKYINDANIKSGVYMSIVVIALELWMIIRTLVKNVIPSVQEGNPFIPTMFNMSSYYFLMTFVALSMLVYSITYTSKKINNKTKLFLNLGFAILPIFQFFLVFIEKYREGREVNNILIVILYVFSLLYGLVIITDSLLRYRFKKEIQALSIVVVTIFATILLAFGIKVSHSDFYSGKEIMCYLTMVIYVACLLIWKPYVSVAMIGTIFLFFYYLLDWTIPHERNAFLEGDIINYITFFISLTMVCISIYMQRLDEAKKDETLEYIANFDTLTGIHNYQHFVSEVVELKDSHNLDDDEYIYVFFNIQNFKTLNTQKGFAEANKYLINLSKLFVDCFGEHLTARVSDDHFVTLTKVSTLKANLEPLFDAVYNLDPDIHLQLKSGGYRFNKSDWDVRHSVDKARYAASIYRENYEKHYAEFDKSMEDEYEAIQYVINHIDKAVEEGWVRPYYQPVVWADDKTLAGCEALARWIDPNKGFLSPGEFVPILENTRLIHKLDQAIIEAVCRDIRRTIDNKLTPIPVSLNFSRLD